MKFTEEQQEILKKCIEVWGVEAQELMAVGECGEFITLQGRKAQGRDTNEDWVSEIADVSIMMEQMAHMRGYEVVQDMINIKLQRLKERLLKNGAIF